MKLLVSVQNAAEAKIALEGGADMIDVKQPSRGPLGCPDGETIVDVVNAVQGKVSVSAALGELFREDDERFSRIQVSATQLQGLQFAKYGLSRAMEIPNWRKHWADAILRLPVGVRPVAVIYADWKQCGAPSPEEMLDVAVDAHCGAILVDTFDKSRGGLLNHISQSELDSILRRSKAESLLAVVGGSLDPTAIGQIAALSPDVIAVRTAVCRDKRTGPIDGEKVRGLKKVVANLFVKTS